MRFARDFLFSLTAATVVINTTYAIPVPTCAHRNTWADISGQGQDEVSGREKSTPRRRDGLRSSLTLQPRRSPDDSMLWDRSETETENELKEKPTVEVEAWWLLRDRTSHIPKAAELRKHHGDHRVMKRNTADDEPKDHESEPTSRQETEQSQSKHGKGIGGEKKPRGRKRRPKYQGTPEQKKAQASADQKAETAARAARFEAGKPTEADIAFRQRKRQAGDKHAKANRAKNTDAARRLRAQLNEDLKSSDPRVREAAEAKRAKQNASSAEWGVRLKEDLKSSDPQVRETAEAKRAKLKASAAKSRAKLKEDLKSSDPQVRKAAEEKQARKAATSRKRREKLREELKSSDPQVRKAAEARRAKQYASYAKWKARKGKEATDSGDPQMRGAPPEAGDEQFEQEQRQQAPSESDRSQQTGLDDHGRNRDFSRTEEKSNPNERRPEDQWSRQTTLTRLGRALSEVQSDQPWRHSKMPNLPSSFGLVGLLGRLRVAAPFLP